MYLQFLKKRGSIVSRLRRANKKRVGKRIPGRGKGSVLFVSNDGGCAIFDISP